MKIENKFKLTPYRGDKLRLARLAKGYSLEELGNILNVTRQNIHKMEAGQEPTSEQMPLLCRAFYKCKNWCYQVMLQKYSPVLLFWWTGPSLHLI